MGYDLDHVQMYEASLVYIRADRIIRGLLSRQLEPFGLGLMEWLLLGVIDSAAKPGITLSAIAARLDVSQPQVTALMDKVTAQRLVHQKIHKTDRRSRTAVLTIKGKRLLDEIEGNIKQFMQTWLSEVPDDQLTAAASLAQRIAAYQVSETD